MPLSASKITAEPIGACVANSVRIFDNFKFSGLSGKKFIRQSIKKMSQEGIDSANALDEIDKHIVKAPIKLLDKYQ